MAEQDRKIWLDAMLRIAAPVLENLSEGRLRETLPLQFNSDRAAYAPLEAFGRTMTGIAPWLALEKGAEEEKALRIKFRELAVMGLENAVTPGSPDLMNFGEEGGQPLVDAAFLAHALLRAPRILADGLKPEVRDNLAKALERTRRIAAVNSNWLFFSAMVEAGIYLLTGEYDRMRLLYPVRVFEEWYKGDGVYGDGRDFHWDYYNSFVIQPMYVDLLELFSEKEPECREQLPKVRRRAARYAAVLERMIGPDGSYPIVGRSVTYRFGAFHLLSQMALEKALPAELHPAQVRCALTAVIQKVMENDAMFDEKGWLRPGVYGCQPELAEGYINTGSLYLCTAVFLPLGLSASDPFWTLPDEDWTSRKIWSGGHAGIDHAI